MSDKILVGIRVRPLIHREVQDGSTQIHWAVGEENKLTHIDPVTKKPIPSGTPYKFDRVFGDNYNNEDIYAEVAEPILESALAGFNGTIFAYGQTSSGKTFTMMGAPDKTTPGVIPLAINHIFQFIEATPDREFLIRASFMEIYNENITDLLATGIARTKGLSVREDSSGQVYVADLKEECCNNEEMLYALMDKGNKNRTVGQTNMNDRSSRSHTIFRIILESRERSDTDHIEEAVTVSHLNLVDLAGSENASQTGATGQRLKEGGFINSSLFMLGRVISQLSEGESYINYRDSKLTRILQSSLGGNAKTAIICTVTPASVEQTHSTLRFASRAKLIKNHAEVNEVLNDAALLKRYAKEIAALKKALETERNTDKAQEVEQVKEKLDEEAREKQELLSRNQELTMKIDSLKEKLVVSSHLPSKAEVVDKRKKLRRETWAAPSQRRAMRMSCVAPLKIDPFKLNNQFLKPELPPWSCGSNSSRGSISSPPHSTPLLDSPPRGIFNNSNLNTSSASMGFGQDPDCLLDMAEESILARHEQDDTFDNEILTQIPPITKRTRRVKFDTGTPPKTFNTVECQTEDTFLRNNLSVTTPSRGFGTPFSAAGTPRIVLRERYKKLEKECEEKDEWLNDWKGELEELSDFQKLELQLREESFMNKLEVGVVDEEKVEELNKEILSLKKSMMDTEGLLLDSNKALSQRNQDIVSLRDQVEELTKDHIAADTLKVELDNLKKDNNILKMETASQKQKITSLENERQDFDMMMQLALDKQKHIEKDLRQSLDDAWEEIANLEGGSKDLVAQRSEKISRMEAELRTLRESNTGAEMEKQLVEMQTLVADTEAKYQNALKNCQAQDDKLEQLEKLVSSMAQLEAKVAEIEHLEIKVNQSLVENQQLNEENMCLKKENDQLSTQVNKSCIESKDLRITINSLQTELDHKALLEPNEEGTPEAYQAKITELQEEVDYLRMKLDESCFTVPRAVGLSPCPPRLLSASSRSNLSIVPPSELSRKLSETIHALEESLLSPITVTPTKNSVSSMDDQFLDPQELHTIKDQLIALQNALMSQEFDLQLQMQSYKSELEYHNQVLLKNEIDTLLWEMQDIFNAEYHRNFISNSECTIKQKMEDDSMNILQPKDTTACIQKANSNMDDSLANSSFAFGFDKQGTKTIDSRSKVCYVAPMSANFTLNDTFETSILNLDTDYKAENRELKHQLEILNGENELLEAVKEKSRKENNILEEEKKKILKDKENLEITLINLKSAYEDLNKNKSTPTGNMVTDISKCNISNEGKRLKNSLNPISPMSLESELQASQDMVMDSTLDNSAMSQESDSKYSTVSMDMTLVRTTSESSPGNTHNSISCLPGEMDSRNVNQDAHTRNTESSSPECRKNSSSSLREMDVTNVHVDHVANLSNKIDIDNNDKFSDLEQKVENLKKENLSLKEKINEMIDFENYKEVKNLKSEVEEVCEEKVKLEKVKEDIINSRPDGENDVKINRSESMTIQEAELKLAENEEEMKKLRSKVQEYLSVIESQKNITKDTGFDSITNKSLAVDSGNSSGIDTNSSISLNKMSLTNSLAPPMSLADELRGLDVSINETFDTSILPNTSIIHNSKRKLSIAPMSIANELKAMEISINETFESSVLNLESNMNEVSQDLNVKIQRLEYENQELKDKLAYLQESGNSLSVNDSVEKSDTKSEKISQLEQKIELIMAENLSLKENLKDQIDEERYNEIQDLKLKVKEVCDEKLKLEEEKENLKTDISNLRSTCGGIKEVDSIQSDKTNEDLENDMSKVKRVQELELQLTENETERKNLKDKVQELVSEIDLLRSKTNSDSANCVTGKLVTPHNLENEVGATNIDQSANEPNLSINNVRKQRKSLAPMSVADELRGADMSINETFDTSVLPHLSFSQNDKQRKSIAPVSLADELMAMEMSINETFETSIMSSSSIKSKIFSRKSIAPMSLADELKAMEKSIDEPSVINLDSNPNENKELKEKIQQLEKEIHDMKRVQSCPQNDESKPIENISKKNVSYSEKSSELKQKVEELTAENSSLKESIREILDKESYKEVEELKFKVKEVCGEKIKLEEEKENLKTELANSQALLDLKEDKTNDNLDKSVSKTDQIEQLESQLTENEIDMKKLENRVQELVSEIEVLKSKTKDSGDNSFINKSFVPDSRFIELNKSNDNASVSLNVSIPLSKVSLPRKSLNPMSLADELRGLDMSINETFDTSAFSNTFSQNIQRKSIAPMSIADEFKAIEGSINESMETSVNLNSSNLHGNKSQKSATAIVPSDELRTMERFIDETFESSVNLGSNIEDESKKLREKISELESENQVLKGCVSNLQEAADNYCLQTDVIADKLQLEKELQETKAQLLDSENKSKDNAELQSKMENLVKEKESLEEELEDYKMVRSKESCKEIEELKTQMEEICREKCVLEEEKINLENSLTKSRAIFSEIHEEEETSDNENKRKEIEKQLLSEESKVSNLEIKLKDVEKEKERLEKVVEEQTARINSLKTRRERRVESCKARRTSRLSVAPMSSLAEELKDANLTLNSINDTINTSTLGQDNTSIIVDELRNVSLDISVAFRTCTEDMDQSSMENTLNADNLETSVNFENQSQENKALKEQINNLKASVSKIELEKNLLERRLAESRIAYEDLQSVRWQVDTLKEEKGILEQNVEEAQKHIQELKASVESSSKESNELEKNVKEIESRETKVELSRSKQVLSIKSNNEPIENSIESEVMEMKSPEKYRLEKSIGHEVQELKSPAQVRLEKRLQLVSNKLADASLQFATIEELESQMILFIKEREMLLSKMKDLEVIQIENNSLLEKVKKLECEKLSSISDVKDLKNTSIQTQNDDDKSNDVELEIKVLKEKLNESEKDKVSLKNRIEELTLMEKEKDLNNENDLSFIDSSKPLLDTSKSLSNNLNEVTVSLSFNETIECVDTKEIATSVPPMSLADELRGMNMEINETLEKSKIEEYANETVESKSFAHEQTDDFESTSLCDLKKENTELKEKIKLLNEKLNESEMKTMEVQESFDKINSHLTSKEKEELEVLLPDEAISSGVEMVNKSLDMFQEEHCPIAGSNKDSDLNNLLSLADELREVNSTIEEVNDTLPSQSIKQSLDSNEEIPENNQTASDETELLKQRISSLTLENKQLVEKIAYLQKVLSTLNENEATSDESNSLRQTVNNLEAQVKVLMEEKCIMESNIVEKEEHLQAENEKLNKKIKLLESNLQEDDLEEMVMRLTEKEEQMDQKIEEMKEAMEEKDNLLSDIRKNLDEKLEANEELTKLLENLSKEKNEYDEVILSLKKELSESLESVKNKEKVILQLELQIKESTNENDTPKPEEIETLQRDIETSKQDTDNSSEEAGEKLKCALSQLAETQNALNSKDKELEKLQAEQDSLRKQVEELTNTLDGNEIEYTNLLEEKTMLQNQLRENNLELDTKLESKGKDLKDAEDQIETLKSTIYDIETKIEMKESELEDTKASLAKVIAAHKIELEEMSHKVKDTETDKTGAIEVQDKLSQKMAELKELEDKNETILKERGNLQIANDNLKTLLSNKTDELKTVTDEHRQQVETFSELVQQKDNEIATLEEKTSKLSENLSVLQLDIEGKTQRISKFETEVEEYRKKVAEKEEEFEALVETSKSSYDQKIHELESENERVFKLHHEVCQEKENMRHLIQSNEGKMKKLLESVESKEKELTDVVVERNELERIKDDLNSKLDLKETENENLTRDLNDTKVQVDNIKIILTGKDVELEQISSERTQLQWKIDELEENKLINEEKIASLSEEIEINQNSMKMKEEETVILLKEKSELSCQLEKMKEVVEIKEKETLDLNIKHDKSEENLKNLEEILTIKENEESKLTSLRSVQQTEMDQLKENLKLKEVEMSQVQLESLSLKEKLDISEKNMNEKLEEVSKLSSELQVLKDEQISLEMKESETIILRREKLEITSLLEKNKETVELKEKELNDLKNKYVTSEETLKNLEDQLKIKEIEESKLMAEKTELGKEMEDLKNALEVKEDKVCQIELECSKFKKQLEVSEETIKEKGEEVSKLCSELKVLKDDHDNLELALKEKNEELSLHKESNEKVKQELIEITEVSKLKMDKITDLEKAIEKKEDEIKHLLSEKNTLVTKCEETEKAKLFVQEKFEAATSEKEELLAKISQLECNYHAKEEELDNVVVEANEMATAIENMQEKITELEANVASLEEDISEKSEKLHTLEFDKQSAEEQLTKSEEAWTKEEEKLVGVIEKYEIEVSEKSSQIEKQENEISDKDLLIEKLNDEKAIMVKEKEEYCVEIKALKSKCILLEEQQMKNTSEKQVNIENAEMVTKLSTLETELKEVKESLHEKEEECDKLNLEIEEVMDHYKKELKVYAEMYNEENRKLIEVKEELSSTQSKLSDVSKSSVISDMSKTSFSHTPEQNVMSVQKKLTDCEAELSKLMKIKQNCDRENEKLKESNRKISNEKDELLQKNNGFKKELENKCKQFDALADEFSDWKQQYSKLFEEKEVINKKLISSIEEIKNLKENKNENIPNVSDIEEIRKQLSIITSEKDVAEKKLSQLDSNYDLLERDYNQLREDADALEEKGINLESFTLLNTKCINLEKEIHSLKDARNTNLGSSQAALGDTEDMKNQISVLKTEKETLEKKLKQIDENYDLLERDYEQLREDCDVLEDQGINLHTYTELKNKCESQQKEIESLNDSKSKAVPSEISGGSMEAINLLKRQNQSLKIENEKLKKQSKDSISKSRESLGSDEMKEKLLSVERKNNELNMKLKALDAPSKKEVLRLTEELRITNLKMNHMRGELRRVQNTKNLDSTISDFQVKKMIKGEIDDESPGATSAPMDFGTGSSIVQEVQVISLENKIYHLERDMKKLKEENTAMEQHVDHYKAKAQEWRDKATKFNHYCEKHKRDVEALRKDNTQLRTKLEETNTKIESQRFDLGHKREIIEKLEKEKKEYVNKYSRSTNIDPVSMQHSQLPTLKEPESKLKDRSESESSSVAARGISRRTSILNPAPLPSQTRIERLPGAGAAARQGQQGAEGGDKVPMWQTMGKENKDYSKYRQSGGSTRRESEENCKQQ